MPTVRDSTGAGEGAYELRGEEQLESARQAWVGRTFQAVGRADIRKGWARAGVSTASAFRYLQFGEANPLLITKGITWEARQGDAMVGARGRPQSSLPNVLLLGS